ncbi:fibronectin type III domain-containing protein [Clostridium chrysemydis]|uniref:fibronectin type III domain-containing protein n=1 Tax=Clostridium chrysemydis TaxID=2665504 RepID=UPI0018842777|nr:glycosyl hydrolase family 18 protein [Clostridium chrysemydis]
MRKYKKIISALICVLFTMTAFSFGDVKAFASATSKPGTPSISHNDWDGLNNYKITMNLWWGQNGTECKLYEDGKVIDSVKLTDNSPNAQSADFSLTNKAKGTYKYKVELINSFGTSTSNEISVTVTQEGEQVVKPSVPTGLSAKANGTSSIDLTWNSVTSVASYDLEADGKVITNVKSPYNHAGLQSASKHDYRVRAVNAAGSSDWSSIVSGTTDSETITPEVKPSTPTNLKVVAISNVAANTSWDKVNNADSYEVSVDNKVYQTTNINYLVSGLLAGSKYSFKVRAINKIGASEWTAPVEITMPNEGQPPTPGDKLKNKLLVGYWHNFDNGSTKTHLKDTSLNFDIIDVAFAESKPDEATMVFEPYNVTPEEFKKEVEYLQSKGKKVIISIGGQNGRLHLDTKEKEDIFVNSMLEIINKYGFDGVDIDLEGGAVSLDPGDTDVNNPTTPRVKHLIDGVKRICQTKGTDFILTMAPEVTYVQGGLIAYAGPWGAYLPVINALRNELTLLHVQHYNHGSQEALDGNTYTQGTADFQVSMAEMMITGFDVGRNPNNHFKGLPASKVAIGLPSCTKAAGGGFTDEAEVIKALDYLIKGKDFGGKYKLRNKEGYKDFRGVMTWSTNWDETVNFKFSNAYRQYFDSLGN